MVLRGHKIFLVCLLSLLLSACGGVGIPDSTTSSGGTGGTGGSSGGGSGVSVNGTLSVPVSSSVSIGKNMPDTIIDMGFSGGLMFASYPSGLPMLAQTSTPITAKAVTEAATGGTVDIYNSSGTLLTSEVAVTAATGKYTAVVDPALLGTDKTVLLKITTTDKSELTDMVDLNGKATGESLSVTNTLTTSLRTQQVLESCGTSFNVGSNLGTCLSSAPRKLVAMYNVFSGLPGTAGTSNTASAQAAFEAMAKAAFASGGASLSDLRKLAQGDSTTIDRMKAFDSTTSSLTTADLVSLGPQIVNGVEGICDDTTTLSKYATVGATAFTKLANLMKEQTLTDLQKITAGQSSLKTMIGSYMDDAISAGNTTALNQFDQPGFGRTIMGLAEGVTQAELTSSVLSGLKTQFSGLTWSGVDPTQADDAFKNLIKASDNATEVTHWGNIDLQNKMAIYAGTSGQTILNGQFTYQVNQGGTGTSLPCSANSDCAAGKVCATALYQCVDATNSGAGLPLGAVCSSDSQCATGDCASSGFCYFPTGIDPLAKQWLLDGATCTSAASCISNVCSGGTCGAQTLSTPSGCSAAAGATSGALTFSCNAVSLATGYKIYRSTSAGFTPSDLTLVTTSATPVLASTGLNNATTYYFRMVSVDANTNAVSTATSEFNAAPGQLSAVTNLSNTAAYQQCTPVWTSIPCSNSGGVDLWVHRSTDTGFTASVPNRITIIDSPATTSYADTGLTNGTAYYYKISCVDTGDLNKTASAQVSCTPVVPVPTNFACTDGASGNANCTWTAASVPSPTYRVYYGTASPITTGDTSATSATTSINITGLSNGTTYFKIRAEKNGSNSQLSSEVSAVVSGAITFKKIFLTATTNTSGNLGGISGADTLCANDANYPGTGTYKALLTGDGRIACTTANCGGGPGEHTGWILAADREYRKTDGTTVIDTTNSNALFTFSLDAAIGTGTNNVQTGLSGDWTWAGTSWNCVNWGSTANREFLGSASATTSGAISAVDFGCDNGGKLYCVEQ